MAGRSDRRGGRGEVASERVAVGDRDDAAGVGDARQPPGVVAEAGGVAQSVGGRADQAIGADVVGRSVIQHVDRRGRHARGGVTGEGDVAPGVGLGDRPARSVEGRLGGDVVALAVDVIVGKADNDGLAGDVAVGVERPLGGHPAGGGLADGVAVGVEFDRRGPAELIGDALEAAAGRRRGAQDGVFDEVVVSHPLALGVDDLADPSVPIVDGPCRRATGGVDDVRQEVRAVRVVLVAGRRPGGIGERGQVAGEVVVSVADDASRGRGDLRDPAAGVAVDPQSAAGVAEDALVGEAERVAAERGEAVQTAVGVASAGGVVQPDDGALGRRQLEHPAQVGGGVVVVEVDADDVVALGADHQRGGVERQRRVGSGVRRKPTRGRAGTGVGRGEEEALSLAAGQGHPKAVAGGQRHPRRIGHRDAADDPADRGVGDRVRPAVPEVFRFGTVERVVGAGDRQVDAAAEVDGDVLKRDAEVAEFEVRTDHDGLGVASDAAEGVGDRQRQRVHARRQDRRVERRQRGGGVGQRRAAGVVGQGPVDAVVAGGRQVPADDRVGAVAGSVDPGAAGDRGGRLQSAVGVEVVVLDREEVDPGRGGGDAVGVVGVGKRHEDFGDVAGADQPGGVGRGGGEPQRPDQRGAGPQADDAVGGDFQGAVDDAGQPAGGGDAVQGHRAGGDRQFVDGGHAQLDRSVERDDVGPGDDPHRRGRGVGGDRQPGRRRGGGVAVGDRQRQRDVGQRRGGHVGGPVDPSVGADGDAAGDRVVVEGEGDRVGGVGVEPAGHEVEDLAGGQVDPPGQFDRRRRVGPADRDGPAQGGVGQGVGGGGGEGHRGADGQVVRDRPPDRVAVEVDRRFEVDRAGTVGDVDRDRHSVALVVDGPQAVRVGLAAGDVGRRPGREEPRRGVAQIVRQRRVAGDGGIVRDDQRVSLRGGQPGRVGGQDGDVEVALDRRRPGQFARGRIERRGGEDGRVGGVGVEGVGDGVAVGVGRQGGEGVRVTDRRGGPGVAAEDRRTVAGDDVDGEGDVVALQVGIEDVGVDRVAPRGIGDPGDQRAAETDDGLAGGVVDVPAVGQVVAVGVGRGQLQPKIIPRHGGGVVDRVESRGVVDRGGDRRDLHVKSFGGGAAAAVGGGDGDWDDAADRQPDGVGEGPRQHAGVVDRRGGGSVGDRVGQSVAVGVVAEDVPDERFAGEVCRRVVGQNLGVGVAGGGIEDVDGERLEGVQSSAVDRRQVEVDRAGGRRAVGERRGGGVEGGRVRATVETDRDDRVLVVRRRGGVGQRVPDRHREDGPGAAGREGRDVPQGDDAVVGERFAGRDGEVQGVGELLSVG